MIIFKSINKLKKELYLNKSVGFVPTMGSLHKGHISLIKKSNINCEKTLVSIFVNPTQFNKSKDYKTYPRNIKKDIKLLKKYKVDYLFLPKFKDLYENKKQEKINIKKKDLILCAKYRKGHFEGVLAVINQYLSKLKISDIFLGEKDYQQFYLLKKFVSKKFKTNVVLCKTIRGKNFFPLSSRNKLLSKKDFKKGQNVSTILKNYYLSIKKNKQNILLINKIKLKILKNVDKLEYLVLKNKNNMTNRFNKDNFKIFICYYLNNVRLIDNY